MGRLIGVDRSIRRRLLIRSVYIRRIDQPNDRPTHSEWLGQGEETLACTDSTAGILLGDLTCAVKRCVP